MDAATSEPDVLPQEPVRDAAVTRRVGQLRLIAGLIARRIVTWVSEGESISRSERISLIQYGSRCDMSLPLSTKILAKLGDKLKVGETIVASFE